jgi:hypothetical protein
VSDLDRALAEISAMRRQMARAVDFRGYGPATFAATGVLAALAAIGQSIWLRNPAEHVSAYLWLWMATAGLSAAVIGVEMASRSRRIHSILADDMVRSAVEQFAPAAICGAALTGIIVAFAPQEQWMLPGLWQLIFGLGVFASCRFLPSAMWLVGAWYVTSGLACLTLANGPAAFSPWAMGIPYSVGQLTVAAVLRFATGGDDAQD